MKREGKYLFFDEVHKYKNWSKEVKNIYDYFSDLKIVITGSSALDIFKSKADLSKRAIMYKMQGLSFHEFNGMGSHYQSLERVVQGYRHFSIYPYQAFYHFQRKGAHNRTC